MTADERKKRLSELQLEYYNVINKMAEALLTLLVEMEKVNKGEEDGAAGEPKRAGADRNVKKP